MERKGRGEKKQPRETRNERAVSPTSSPSPPRPSPSPASPFRRPPPPQAVASAEHRLSFRGWLGAPRHWDHWVAKLRPLHAPLWRRLGIHDAVIASTYRFKRDASSILHLVSFWSPDTATFAFPWGEATLTLHDIALIGGFPADGSPLPAPLPPQWRPDEAALNAVRLGFNRSACKKAHHSAWVKHFLNDRNDAVLEHAAFLALWLTRFALPGHPESTMRQAVFPIAVRLARGDRVALAPAVLASLYRDLRDIKAFLVATAGTGTSTGDVDAPSSLPIYSPIYILQLWMWERFPALRPARDNQLLGDAEPVAARWHDLGTRLNPRLVREVLSSGDNFLWHPPYAASLSKYSGWVSSADLSSNRHLRLLAHCLRPCELVGLDCIEQYLPHRVTRQFGLDQDVPGDVPRANETWAVAWQTYELEGKNATFFIPQSQPGITARYAQWWRQQLPPLDLHAEVPAIPVEPKASKRKVKKTPAAMEAEAEKERRMKKARFSPSDKKRKLEELYDAQMSGWLAAGRSGMNDASGGSCKSGSLPKYDMGSDDALLPNVGATNDDVVLLVPRMQTASHAAAVPKKDDTMNPAIVHGGNFIADKPPEIPNDATAMLKEEKHGNPVGTSFDTADKPEEGGAAVVKPEKEVMEKLNISDSSLGITDKPEEGHATVTKLEKEAMGKLNISMDRSLDITDKPEEGGAMVTKSEKEAMEKLNFSVDKSFDIADRLDEGATMVMKSENEVMETHSVPVDRSLDLTHRLEGGAAAIKSKKDAMELLNISAGRSLELTDKPEGSASVTKSGNEDREKLKISVDRSLDITDNPERGAAVMKSEKEAMEKLNISVCRSLDITERLEGDTIMELRKEVMETHSVPVDSVSFDLTDRPEEATVALELEKEAMGLSDISEEVTAPAIEEKEEGVVIEGDVCVVGVNPLENDGEIVMGADEGNKVSEEIGRDAGKLIEAVPQIEQGIDAHVMNNSHDAAALPAEALPSQCTRIDGGCSKVSYIMEDSNVSGSMCTKDGETTGRDFVSEDNKEVPCLEEIGGKNKGTVEKDSNEKPQETPQTEIVECVEKNVLVGIYNVSAQKELHATVEEAVTSHSRDTSVLSAGVPETENVEVDQDLNLAKNDAEDIPVEVAGEEVEQEQTNTLEKGGAEEEHMEFSDVGHTNMTYPKTHSCFNIETPKKAAKIESAKFDNATRLTGRDTDGKIGDVLELGHAEVEEVRGLMANISDEKLAQVSQVEHAEEEHTALSDIGHTDMADPNMHSYFNTKTPEKAAEVGSAEIDSATILTGRDADANGKIGDVLEVGHAEEAKVRGLIVNASDEKLAEVSQVERAVVKCAEGLMKEHTNCKFEEVSGLETTESEGTHGPMEEDTDGNLKGIHDVNAEMEDVTEHDRDSNRPKGILQIDQLAKDDVEDDSTKTPQLEYGNLRDAAPIEEDTKENPCSNGKDLPEKDVNEFTEVSKVKQAEEEGCDLLLEKDDNISDALGVEQAAERQGKALTKKGIHIHCHFEEIVLVEQLDGQSGRLTRIENKDISEKINLAHEKESDNDMMKDLKNSTNGETPCGSPTVQLKGGTMEKHCVQNADLINHWELSSDAAAMKDLTQKQNQDHRIIDQNKETAILERSHMLDSGMKSDLTLEVDEIHTAGGIQNLEISDLDKEIALKQKQDHMETIVLGGSHMLDSRVKLDSATLEVDETHAGGRIQNKDFFYMDKDHAIICENKAKTAPGAIHMLDTGAKSSFKVDKTHATEGIEIQELLKFDTQQGMNVIQNLGAAIENNNMSMPEDAGVPLCSECQIGTAIENSKMNMSEDVDIPIYNEYQIDPTANEVNDVESTKRLQNQEPLDNKEQLEMDERQHQGTTIENSKRNFPDEADILVCDECQIDSICTEVKCTKGIQNQEPLDNKDQVMEKTMECELVDGSGISLEEASKLGDGADTCAAPLNAAEDKQHHGVEHVNEKSLEDRIMIDSGELRCDATVVEADMAGSKEGMRNHRALISEEMEAAVEEKQDQEMADEDTNRDLADINELDCEVQPDGAVKMSHVALLTTQAVDIEGSKVSSENKVEGPFEEYNITKDAGSELNQTAGMEPEGALPPEPENLVGVRQENLDETERSIFRENDEASCKDQTSTGVIISPLNMDDQDEDDNRWAEQSTKSYDKLASDSICAASCQPVKFGKSSAEEVERTQDIRSIYLKDIKESLGRIRAEPLNRVHATNVAYSSRHAVQESHSACKEIKVPLHDSGRDFGRDRALDLVVTSPAEEASRWRQEQYALQILEDVQNARIAEKTRMEMEIRILKSQIASTERRVMNLDHLSEVKSRSKRH
ncbi:hypothetical protein U9M48_011317 [Paspalum notatum var. saurae]|uniref:Aminotransferase-like plant mobile domain-containing protein n=1 Tax=Paspalum notatum var. saurae TaxID=547442 RepID=A0AAQ3SVC2_PASNO